MSRFDKIQIDNITAAAKRDAARECIKLIEAHAGNAKKVELIEKICSVFHLDNTEGDEHETK